MKKIFGTFFYSLYHLLVNLFGLVKVFPTKVTSRKQLITLMNILHPVNSGFDLIRLGPEGDGGYLVPDDLIGIEACFSPGVCNSSGFEKDCANLGMKIFLADKSVDGPPILDKRFNFVKKFIGATTSDSFMTIDDWVNSSLPESKSDLLLQIDIEGYEYETFLSMSNFLIKRFRIIVVEFHHLEQLWNKPFFRLALPVFEKILKQHICVHIHPNNCGDSLKKNGLIIPDVMEFTFLRKDRIKSITFVKSFPHMLDSRNIKISSLTLPKCWYQQS